MYFREGIRYLNITFFNKNLPVYDWTCKPSCILYPFIDYYISPSLFLSSSVNICIYIFLLFLSLLWILNMFVVIVLQSITKVIFILFFTSDIEIVKSYPNYICFIEYYLKNTSKKNILQLFLGFNILIQLRFIISNFLIYRVIYYPIH